MGRGHERDSSGVMQPKTLETQVRMDFAALHDGLAGVKCS